MLLSLCCCWDFFFVHRLVHVEKLFYEWCWIKKIIKQDTHQLAFCKYGSSSWDKHTFSFYFLFYFLFLRINFLDKSSKWGGLHWKSHSRCVQKSLWIAVCKDVRQECASECERVREKGKEIILVESIQTLEKALVVNITCLHLRKQRLKVFNTQQQQQQQQHIHYSSTLIYPFMLRVCVQSNFYDNIKKNKHWCKLHTFQPPTTMIFYAEYISKMILTHKSTFDDDETGWA